MGIMKKKQKSCPCCGRYPTRSVTIDALIVQNKKILLIKRGVTPYKDRWALPGGHVDFDETVEEAVRREVREETNLTVTSAKLLGVYSSPKRHPKQAVAVSYIVDAKGDAKAGDDAENLDFFPLDDLPENLAFDHKEIIGDYLAKAGIA